MPATPLDPAHAPEPDLRALHALSVANDTPPQGIDQPYPDWLLHQTVPHPMWRENWWVTRDDTGAVTAAVRTRFRDGPDNRHRLDTEVYPPPSGDPVPFVRQLLRAVSDQAHELNRDLIGCEVQAASPLVALLDEVGAKCASAEQHNVARLDARTPAELDEVIASAQARAADYELVTWDDRCPDVWLDDYVGLATAMNTAPRDDMNMEDMVWDGADLRASEATMALRGSMLWDVAVRHRGSGKLVAHTEILLSPHYPEVAHQENTVVLPAHRGHGLGMWVKAVNQRRLLRERPDVVCISTWNAASNNHMVGINRALGYLHEHTWEEYEVPLATLDAWLEAEAR